MPNPANSYAASTPEAPVLADVGGRGSNFAHPELPSAPASNGSPSVAAQVPGGPYLNRVRLMAESVTRCCHASELPANHAMDRVLKAHKLAGENMNRPMVKQAYMDKAKFWLDVANYLVAMERGEVANG